MREDSPEWALGYKLNKMRLAEEKNSERGGGSDKGDASVYQRVRKRSEWNQLHQPEETSPLL